jgi:hypothetical protein
MKITIENRIEAVRMARELRNAAIALKSAAECARKLGSGDKTTDTAGSLELRAFKVQFRGELLEAAIAKLDAIVEAKLAAKARARAVAK